MAVCRICAPRLIGSPRTTHVTVPIIHILSWCVLQQRATCDDPVEIGCLVGCVVEAPVVELNVHGNGVAFIQRVFWYAGVGRGLRGGVGDFEVQGHVTIRMIDVSKAKLVLSLAHGRTAFAACQHWLLAVWGWTILWMSDPIHLTVQRVGITTAAVQEQLGGPVWWWR